MIKLKLVKLYIKSSIFFIFQLAPVEFMHIYILACVIKCLARIYPNNRQIRPV